MNKSMIQAELPPELAARAREYVNEGWATDLNAVVAEALRRFLESHPVRAREAFVMEDVKWGLHGKD